MSKFIWIDTNILIYIEKGVVGFEAELLALRRDGYQLLIPQHVEYEFLHAVKTTEQSVARQKILGRIGIQVDKMAGSVPIQQLRQWRDAIGTNLSIPDANMVVQIRAGAQARKAPAVLFTRDAGGTLARMRENGVIGVEFQLSKSNPAPPKPPPTPPPAPKVTPPKVTPKVTAPKVGPARTPAPGGGIDELDGITRRLGRATAGVRGTLAVRLARGIGVNLILGLIGSYLEKREQKKRLESDLGEIEKEVRATLQKKDIVSEIAKAQLTAEKDEIVYATYAVEIGNPSYRPPRFRSFKLEPYKRAWMNEEGVQIVALSEWNKRFRGGTYRIGQDPERHPVIEGFVQFVEVSVYTQEELDAFDELEELYHAAKLKAVANPYNPDVAVELNKVKQKIVETFGNDIPFRFRL